MIDLIAILKNAAASGQGVEVVYQPKVNSKLQLCGAEALIRLNIGAEILLPGAFIDLAEEHGVMEGISHHLLDQVIALQHTCLSNGIIPIPISVNIAPSQIATTMYMHKMTQMMEAKEVPLNLIELEILETLLTGSTPNRDATLMASILILLAQKAGVKIAIDDFGTGQSTLSRLVDLPVQIIKLDRRFTSIDDERNRAVVAGTIEMAKRLGLSVIAEGVETKEQADFFWTAGVDMIQGFLYFPPLRPEDYLSLLMHATIKQISTGDSNEDKDK